MTSHMHDPTIANPSSPDQSFPMSDRQHHENEIPLEKQTSQRSSSDLGLEMDRKRFSFLSDNRVVRTIDLQYVFITFFFLF